MRVARRGRVKASSTLEWGWALHLRIVNPSPVAKLSYAREMRAR